MDLSLVIKIAVVGVVVAVLNLVLARSGREDIATLCSVAGLIVVLLMILGLVGDLIDNVQALFRLY